MSVNSKMTAIADNIRSVTGKTEKLNIDEMALSINEVYDKGIVDGKKAEYDNFWDSFQDYGNRTRYSNIVEYTTGWAEWFYPKYDMKPTVMDFFARESKTYSDGTLLDSVERLNECGVKLDLSECTSASYIFYNATISHLPELDLRNVKQASISSYLFGRYIETIDNFIFDGEKSHTSTFQNATNLKDIVFTGTLKTTLTMQHCKALSKQSIESLFNCLATDTSGLTVTLSKQAKEKAFNTSETIQLNKIFYYE
jgi:hypothetical protein